MGQGHAKARVFWLPTAWKHLHAGELPGAAPPRVQSKKKGLVLSTEMTPQEGKHGAGYVWRGVRTGTRRGQAQARKGRPERALTAVQGHVPRRRGRPIEYCSV